MVEGQPLGGHTCKYRIHDAKIGKLAAGDIDVGELRKRQPWESGGVER
jgi:hypothetical protein